MPKSIPKLAFAEKRTYDIFFIVVAIIFIICTIITKFNPFDLIGKSSKFWEFIVNDFLRPQFPTKASRVENIFSGILVTIAMAVGATSVAAILAFFVSLFASEKVSPFPKSAKIVRGVATFIRNIPALVWAFILFSSLGIGTGVGFIALTVTSFAFMIRAFAETIDDVSQDCIESLQATGATFPQRVAHAIIPSCMGEFLSWFLYCVEVNVRASTIVGMVGGGGIGLVLFTYIKSFNYNIASSIILIIALMVMFVDLATGYLRRELKK